MIDESFTLITDSLPDPYYLVLIQDEQRRKVRGWHTVKAWDFSSTVIIPYSWKKIVNRILDEGEYKKV